MTPTSPDAAAIANTMNDFLALTAAILTAAGSEPVDDERTLLRKHRERVAAMESRREHRRRLRLDPESDDKAEAALFGGPLWSVRTPVPAGAVQKVIAYAADQQLSIGGVHGCLKSVKGTPEGLVITIDGGVWERHVTATLTIEYGNELERNLALGNWVKCPYGQVRLTQLIPTLKPTSYGAEVRIGAEFQRPGWFQRLFSGKLEHVELHPTYARPIVDNRVKTFVLPDVAFIEKPVADFASGKVTGSQKDQK